MAPVSGGVGWVSLILWHQRTQKHARAVAAREQGGVARSAPSRPVSAAARWLEQRAGFVLIAAGSGLVVLAAFYAHDAAVAPVFAVFGP